MSPDLGRGRELDPGTFGMDISALPPHDAGPFDPRSLFADPTRPFEIEIGSGKGTFLLQQATQDTSVNRLGIEWAREYWLYAADRMRRHGLDSVRMLRADATQFVRHWCPAGIAQVIHLYFSDPWPKARHHKRRVVQDETLREFRRVLVTGGELRIVTDHDELWTWCEEHAARATHLFERLPFQPPAADAGELVGTNFERKFRREGRPFHAMTLRARAATAA